MAGFDERIRIIVEAVGTGKAASEMKQLDDRMTSSGKAATGWQQNLSKAGTFIGNNLPALVATGAAAVVAFAAKSVSAFQDTALSAGKLADSTGLSTEAASRWNEVAGDVGIGTEQLGKSFGFLLKGIGKTPEAFRELGITAQDSNGQILQAIDLLNQTPAGAERAALGAKLFGRSWAEVSELVAQGAGKVKKSLDEVSDAKVIDSEEVQKARAYRAAMDELADSFEDVSLSIGENLVPGLAAAATGLAKLLQSGPVQEFIEVVGSAADALGEILTNLADWDGGSLAFNTGSAAIADYNQLLQDFGGSWEAVLAHYQELARTGGVGGRDALQLILDMKQAAEDADPTIGSMGLAYETAAERGEHLAEASSEVGVSVKEAAAASKEYVDHLKEMVKATQEMLDASSELADVNAELPAMMLETSAAIAEYAKVSDDAKSSDLDRANALEAAIKQSDAMGDSLVDQAKHTAAARGQTLSNVAGIDTWNKSMANAAAQAKGPLRDAILSYIATANQIPPEKLTNIKAAIARGDLAEAERLLAQTSRTRDAAIIADAQTGQAERDLNYVARNRQATLTVQVRQSGQLVLPAGASAVARAGGGPVTQGMPYMVGEQGKEWFVPKTDGYIMNAADTARALSNGGGGSPVGRQGGGMNVTINVSGADPQRVVDALDRYVRAHGARRLQAMVA